MSSASVPVAASGNSKTGPADGPGGNKNLGRNAVCPSNATKKISLTK